MHRCFCSSRALELFIKDFAGLNIRRTAPRTPIRPYTRRTFSTRPARRQQAEAAFTGLGAEDGFIPFEFEKIRRLEPETEPAKRDVENEGKEDGEGEEWHAEIEISGSWPSRTRDAVAESSEVRGGEHAESLTQEADMLRETEDRGGASDEADGRNTQPLSTAGESTSMESATLDASKASPPPDASQDEGERSRAENRMARKQRRLQAGKYAPARAERAQAATETQVDEDEEGVASALEKIEGMAGPPVAHTKKKGEGKTAKEDTLSGGTSKPKSAKPKSKEAEKAQLGSKEKSKLATKANAEQELWQSQKAALQSKFGAKGWDPNKKVSPDTMAGIRALHASNTTQYSTATLAKHFEISPEAIRRILRSKWTPTEEEAEHRRQRWEKRGVRKWDEMAKKGIRPPKKWREAGVGWERKSRSLTKRSEGLRSRGRVGVTERKGDLEEGVGMLGGIDEERIL